MIYKCQFLFCDNEHGNGDVSFPDVKNLDAFQIQQAIMQGNSVNDLRRQAKQQGWGRVNGGDYCPGCMESM